jgi:CRP-like cAMP-binding protein
MSPSTAQPPAALTIRADMWAARRASGWLESAALAQNVPREQVVRLDHCLDEALANVIRHGGPAALSSPVHLQFGVRRGRGACTAELSVSDAGVTFDPFVAIAPQPASLVDATPGGLGLLLIRNFSDELSYCHNEGRNHLTITVSWVEEAMTHATPDWLLELRNARGAGIDAIALFRGAEPSVIVEAITDCETRILPVGATLLQPGQSNDTIYVLLSGQLAAYLDGARRPETGIPIQPGESVGEMSAIDGKPVSAFVVAVTESRLLLLPGKLFWSRLGNIPGVTRNLLASLSERMRRGNEAMLEAQRKQLALEHVGRELQIARQFKPA